MSFPAMAARLRRIAQPLAEQFQDGTATILKYTSSVDADTGAPVITYPPQSTTYPARIAKDARPQEAVVAGKLTVTTFWKIYLQLDSLGHVDAMDRISSNGRTFEVLGPVGGDYDVENSLLCLEVL